MDQVKLNQRDNLVKLLWTHPNSRVSQKAREVVALFEEELSELRSTIKELRYSPEHVFAEKESLVAVPEPAEDFSPAVEENRIGLTSESIHLIESEGLLGLAVPVIAPLRLGEAEFFDENDNTKSIMAVIMHLEVKPFGELNNSDAFFVGAEDSADLKDYLLATYEEFDINDESPVTLIGFAPLDTNEIGRSSGDPDTLNASKDLPEEPEAENPWENIPF